MARWSCYGRNARPTSAEVQAAVSRLECRARLELVHLGRGANHITPRAERRGFGGVASNVLDQPRSREASRRAGPVRLTRTTRPGVPRALHRMSGLPDMRV